MENSSPWVELPYPAWRETCSALHLYTQIVGKYRLSRTPWLNHAWHATLYVDGRGLTTSRVPDAAGGIEIRFDLVDHAVTGEATDGRRARFDLAPMSVAEFHTKFVDLLRTLGSTAQFHGRPNELTDPVPFAVDHAPRPYDAEAVTRYFQVLVTISSVFECFRTAYLGKVSPVHLFWGSFDLAVTRFSGRRAPLHPGGIPFLPDEITREAYSHEVASAGFWPGGGGVDHPSFYAYAYPVPNGYSEAHAAPRSAYFSKDLGEFLLPYDTVRLSDDPEATLMAFLQSTYEAAATLGGWDRSSLECAIGKPLQPRRI